MDPGRALPVLQSHMWGFGSRNNLGVSLQTFLSLKGSHKERLAQLEKGADISGLAGLCAVLPDDGGVEIKSDGSLNQFLLTLRWLKVTLNLFLIL